jgi:hypothetical protein
MELSMYAQADENGEMQTYMGHPIDQYDLKEYFSKPYQNKYDAPYSYDPFSSFYLDSVFPNHTVYSDRFYLWGEEKYRETCQKAFGESSPHFNKRTPEEVETFLRIYYQDPKLVLTRIVEWCNKSNGYPYYCFYFNSTNIKE